MNVKVQGISDHTKKRSTGTDFLQNMRAYDSTCHDSIDCVESDTSVVIKIPRTPVLKPTGGFKKSSNLMNETFIKQSTLATPNIVSKSNKRCVSSLQAYDAIPSKKTQSKIDYFITPYNKTLHYDKYMNFDSRAKEEGETFSSAMKQSNDWSMLMNFVVNEENAVFRRSLRSINNGLYLELNNIIKEEAQRRKQRKRELEDDHIPPLHSRSIEPPQANLDTKLRSHHPSRTGAHTKKNKAQRAELLNKLSTINSNGSGGERLIDEIDPEKLVDLLENIKREAKASPNQSPSSSHTDYFRLLKHMKSIRKSKYDAKHHFAKVLESPEKTKKKGRYDSLDNNLANTYFQGRHGPRHIPTIEPIKSTASGIRYKNSSESCDQSFIQNSIKHKNHRVFSNPREAAESSQIKVQNRVVYTSMQIPFQEQVTKNLQKLRGGKKLVKHRRKLGRVPRLPHLHLPSY